MLIHAKEEDVPDIRAYLSDVHAEVIDHRRWAAPWHVIEIIKSGMNKAVGLKKSAITTRSPLSASSLSAMKIMTEMLAFAGCGVAMENGIDSVKQIADTTTFSNEEDGVSRFLKQHFSL